MKRYIAFFMFSFLCITSFYSQGLPKTVWGCEFGCNRAKVVESLKKQNLKFEYTGSNIRAYNLNFGGLPFTDVLFHFYMDELYLIGFNAEIRNASASKNYIDRFKSRYGKPASISTEDGYAVHWYFDGDISLMFYSNAGIFSLFFMNSTLLGKAVDEE